MNGKELWQRYTTHLSLIPALGLSVDISRMRFDGGFFARMEPGMQEAFRAMDALEAGAIANPDERRMVGHYWLRASHLAPRPELRGEIDSALAQVKELVAGVRSGTVKPERAPAFTDVLAIGIGGSALGPMFVADALGEPRKDRMRMHFLDNTDPDGIHRTLSAIEERIASTLSIVTSKSGGTPETHNGMKIAAERYARAGLSFPRHAVAITMKGSRLDESAAREGWLARLPMFDWVGGRTSELSAVGLLPAALQGIDIDGMIEGAAACDEVTRRKTTAENPAAILALMWHHATGGKGLKDMVVLPYKDRLLLFSRYLQQLVMESLGKRLDLQGKRVDQGLTVYGNKGSTDQHAYVQQLRDGVNNFFVVFIRVLEAGSDALRVEEGATVGDFLDGFLLGTRQALWENERESLTITLRRVDARTVGGLIALFERAVGYYASLVGINAYHQPGVEAGKKAAASVLGLQAGILGALSASPRTAEEIAGSLGAPDSVETVYLILEHLAANGRARASEGGSPASMRFVRA